ncbi:unnamed protein product [Heterobilharzia americana]|nr:unnamed protein product [Heterobilharzia americana]
MSSIEISKSDSQENPTSLVIISKNVHQHLNLQQSLTEEKTSDINDQHSSSITPSLPSDYLNTTMMMDLNKSSVPFIDSHDDNNLENVSNSIFKQSECELDMMNNSDSKLMSFNESIIELETFSIYPPTDQVNDEYNTLENNVGKMIFLTWIIISFLHKMMNRIQILLDLWKLFQVDYLFKDVFNMEKISIF